MTCVFDSLIRKLPKRLVDNVLLGVLNKSPRIKAACFLNDLKRRVSTTRDEKLKLVTVNGTRQTDLQVKETRQAISDIIVGDGYLMSTFDPLYIAVCAIYSVDIRHVWRHTSGNVTLIYKCNQNIPNVQQVTFTSSSTHTS